MRTDRAVTRPSSERVVMRSIVDRQTYVKTLPSFAVGKYIIIIKRNHKKCRCIQLLLVNFQRNFKLVESKGICFGIKTEMFDSSKFSIALPIACSSNQIWFFKN